MTKISSLCVFCGSKMGADPAHVAAARRLGEQMAERGIRLVYGGGSIGLMGVLSDAVLKGVSYDRHDGECDRVRCSFKMIQRNSQFKPTKTSTKA